MLTETNDVQSQMRIVSTYLYALVTTDRRDDRGREHGGAADAQRRNRPAPEAAGRVWLAGLGVEEFALRSIHAAEHGSCTEKSAEGAELQMSEAEESLSAELAPAGSLAGRACTATCRRS